MAREDVNKTLYSLPTFLPAWVEEQDRLIAENEALENILFRSVSFEKMLRSKSE